MKKIFFTFKILFASILLNAQNFHDTQGKLDISGSGQATYTVPIAMPPSLKNTAPVIDLVYTSGQFGGIAGQGWAINSISAISRISTRMSIDGLVDGVDFDDNDKLALDGQRLMLKNGVYWADNSTYQTEVHSNSKIELKGSGSSIYFIVTAPDGSRCWYGNYGGMNATDLTAFYIVRFEDADGNYITYHYTNPLGYSLCISEIKFSANVNGLTPLNSIKFNYKASKRIESSYVKGMKHQKGVLLDNVEVFTAQQLFRKYQLTHIVDSQLGYERVSQVQEFNGAGEPANPILFSYDTTVTQAAGSEIKTSYSNNINFSDIGLSGDFDGDGRLDFIGDNKLYTKLFQGATGNTFNMPYYINEKNFAINTLIDNKFNQQNSIVYINKQNNYETTFKVVNFENGVFNEKYSKTIALDRSILKTPIGTNSGSTGAVQCLQYYNQTGQSTSYITPDYVNFYAGDFDGNGISEILVQKSPKSYKATFEAFYPQQPYTFNPNDCILNIQATSDITYYLIDLNPNEPVTYGSQGYLEVASSHLPKSHDINYRMYYQDFNGDGKTDILLTYGTFGNNYNEYKLFEINKTPHYATTVLIGSGTLPDYTRGKQILFGDYNGDGKTDLILPGSEGGSGQTTWHIYYCNPNPAGGSAFTKETHNIVEYWPTTGNHYDTQIHYSNYYSMDTNNDGKSDIVRVWRKYYKPSGTINDHNTKWSVSTYVNNIGNTQVTGNKFTLDYSSPCNDVGPFTVCDHPDDSPEMPTPVVSNFNYNGLDNQLVMVRNHTSEITYINFTKDVSKDILLKKVTNSGGNIIDEITYEKMEPVSTLNNGLGGLSEFYSSLNSLTYPNVELKRLPGVSLVSKLKNTSEGLVKYQDFRYHGFAINMQGLGNLGFRKFAHSAWYQNLSEKRIWNVIETNPLWRGGVSLTYSQLVNTGSAFSFIGFGTVKVTGIVNRTTNVLSCVTDENNIFKVFRDTETIEDLIAKTKEEKKYYNNPGNLTPTSIVTSYYVNNEKQGESVENFGYLNNPNGVGSLYYIGRPSVITKNVIAYNDLYKTSELYIYTGSRLTKIKRKGNTDEDNYLTEELTYDDYGNIIKKASSYEGYAGTPVPRVLEYTYDPTGRFLKTSKDVEGLITTYNSYHPLYGLIVSVTDPFARTTTNEYDSWGKIKKEIDYLNNSTTYTYSKTANEYTTAKTFPDGSSSLERNDALGRLKISGVKNIDATWSYKKIEYDFYGRKYRESEPYSSGNPTQWNTVFYDDYNRVKQQVIATGKITNITYSGLTVTADDGIKTTSSTKNANGHIVSATDEGGTINYTYFAHGGVKTTNYENNLISVEYDEWARKKKLIDPAAGTYQYNYSPFGEIVKEVNPKGEITFLYNGTGKLIEKYNNENGYGWDITYVYNPVTKMLTYTDWYDIQGEQHVVFYKYDQFMRVVEEEESSNYTKYKKTFTYDSFGKIEKESFFSEFNGQSSLVNITNVYKNGYKWKIIDDLSGQVLWQANTVNARGQLLTATLGNGISISNSFDNYGYTTQIKHSKTQAPLSDIMVLNTDFDAQRGNLKSRTNSMFAWNESFQYDSLDRLIQYTNVRGEQEIQAYDNKGRISENSLGTYEYANPDKIYQQSSMNLTEEGKAYFGIREGLFFNTMEDGKGMKIISPTTTIYDSSKAHTGKYSLRLNESSSQIVDADSGVNISNATITQYSYSGWIYNESPSASISLVMDFPGGNSTVSTLTTVMSNWTYVEGSYMVPSNVTKLALRVAKSGSGNVWFDDLKLIKTSESTTQRKLNIIYNMFKSPLTIEETGVTKIDFDYNSHQYRSAMYYGSLSTNKFERPFRNYYSSGGEMQIKYDLKSGALEFITYIGGDGYSAPIVFKKKGVNSEYFYLHRDYQGSIMAITNSAGNVVEKRLFDAWGNILKVQDGTGNNLSGLTVLDRGYTGHEHIESVGLINMNGRLYDAKLHHFLQPDNFIQEPNNTQNYNRYAYVLNNPLKYTDVSGEEFTFLTAALIGAIIAATTYTITALTADVPFSVGGLIKTTFTGAVSGAVTFGIGEAAQSICQFAVRLTFQAFAHGFIQGSMTGIQGGNFWQGFSAGAVSSMVSTVWSGGEFNNSYVWKGIGGAWGSNDFGLLAFGTVSGGVGAALTKGNFWVGSATGLSVTLLNHVAHKISARKTLLQRFKMGKNKKYLLEPFGVAPDFSAKGIEKINSSVEGLEDAYIAGGKPKVDFDLTGDYGFTDPGKVSLNKTLIKDNYVYAAILFHEYRHAWQYIHKWYDWVVKYGVLTTRNLAERDAYGFQLQIGGGSVAEGDYRFNKFYTSTSHIKHY